MRFLFFVSAGISLEVLMHLMVHHAAEDGVILFVPFMMAFFGLRKMRHSLESHL